jgi:hypothetical protein
MQNMGEFETWRQHREELAQEIENEHLARRLRLASRENSLGDTLTGRVMDRVRGALRSPAERRA